MARAVGEVPWKQRKEYPTMETGSHQTRPGRRLGLTSRVKFARTGLHTSTRTQEEAWLVLCVSQFRGYCRFCFCTALRLGFCMILVPFLRFVFYLFEITCHKGRQDGRSMEGIAKGKRVTAETSTNWRGSLAACHKTPLHCVQRYQFCCEKLRLQPTLQSFSRSPRVNPSWQLRRSRNGCGKRSEIRGS